MRSSSAKVGLLDKPPVLPWIYQEMVNLEVSGMFFFNDAFLEYKSKESVFFKWLVPWQEDTSKTALANPMEQCSAQCLGKGAIVKTLSAEHSGAQVLKIPEEELCFLKLVHWCMCGGRGNLPASGNSLVILLGKPQVMCSQCLVNVVSCWFLLLGRGGQSS